MKAWPYASRLGAPVLSSVVGVPAALPETQLLLACARTRLEAETTERIRGLIQHGIDWPSLITQAGYHGVAPLLYHSLQATCPEAVPTSVMAQLQQFFQANALHNLGLSRDCLYARGSVRRVRSVER